MKKFSVLVTLLILFSTIHFFAQTTKRVPSQYSTIQEAINATQNGDTIVVSSGTYYENINFISKAILLKSDGGALNTTINGNKAGSCVSFVSGETTASIIDGFTITNGSGTLTAGSQHFGGGIYSYNGSKPTINNCIITGNSAYAGSGGGIGCWYASAEIHNCIIKNNTNHGISNAAGSGVLVVNCLIYGNYGEDSGGGISAGAGSSPTIINSTIVQNDSYQHTNNGIYATSGGTVINSIVRDNVGVDVNIIQGTTTVIFSNIEGGFTGTGNIDFDPLFVDPVHNNYHLSDASPCIGSATPLYAPSIDIEFNPRPNPSGSNPDMGAYENALANPNSQNSGIKYVKSNASGMNNGTSWTDAYTSFQLALTASVSGDQIWVAKGTYKPSSAYDLTSTSRYYHFRMINGVTIYGGFAGSESAVSERTTFGAGQANETILSGDLNNNGKDDNDCYHVFYHPSGLDLTAKLDGFTIKGGNANGTSQHAEGGGMYNSSASPTLTNCTFTSNSAAYGSGMYNFNYSSPSLTNCIFTSNSAEIYGGGVHNDGDCSPILINCIFTSNSASNRGGGMYNVNSSSPTITNCTFTSNSAYYYAGGMLNGYYSSPNLTNCTFSSNLARNGGGMFNEEESFPSLNNCIIWGNDASTNGDEFFINGGGITLNYSCYANVTGDVYNINGGILNSTNNNITSDPLFVGSTINPAHPYSIPGTSPCADAGNDSYNSQAYDIRGEGYPRKLNKTTSGVGTIDMGAYEYQLNNDPLPVALTSFSANISNDKISLSWKTSTEVNSWGFDIERMSEKSAWFKIGFVQSSGNSNSVKEYSFIDRISGSGNYFYRLKQIDKDGNYEYSKIVEVNLSHPKTFLLSQNYPNPFNPNTIINYDLPVNSSLTLRVFNILGKEIITLVNEEKPAGRYQVTLDGSNLSSGVYYYQLKTETFTDTKKLLLLK